MVAENLQIDLIRERFLKLNRDRIQRTQQLMLPSQRDLLELLPLLFHVNSNALPGFIDGKTPFGVFDYILTDTLLTVAKRQWGGFSLSRQGVWRYDIEAIFLMGSCGTIAFNRKSDFDVWLCHRPDLNEAEIITLQKKAERIEEWFESIGLEVHFFLMNAITFRDGKVTKLSSESSGTAQHRLLLDEFYRSSIWLGGKTPFWWYVPPEKEASYKELQAELVAGKIISEESTIDFGGLPDIPTSEFFGAAVWQIYKGIDSPYKSILKITLMESYAGSYPKNTPLSAEFKLNIYNGVDDPEALDPYLTMLQRLETHLKNIKETDRLEVIRRSFYLKLNIALSNTYEKDNWRKNLIENLVGSWGWSTATIEHLDNQKNWRLEQVTEERKLLMVHLTKSYAFLSGFAREHAKKRLINQKDLSILGRKLYSVFDRKPGKIEIFNRGIVDNIKEDSVTLMLLHGKDERDNWRLYRGRVTGDQFKKSKPLKQTFSLIELVSWMHFNQLISDTTQKLLYAPGSDISGNDFNLLLVILDKITLAANTGEPETKAFLTAPCILKSLVFLNIGKPANIVGNNTDRQLISGEIDALNCGAKTECLVQTIEYCYINSWKEIFVFKYYGVDGIAQFICNLLEEYLAFSKQHENVLNVSPEIHSFGTHISYVLSSRFSKLLNSVLTSYLSSSGVNCYIYEAGKKLYCIHHENDKFDFDCYDNVASLMEHMSLSNSSFRSVVFDDIALQGHALKSAYVRNKEGVIQLFLLAGKNAMSVYVLDEFGVLFHQKMPLDELVIVARHFTDFIQRIVEKSHLREAEIPETIEPELLGEELEVYKLTKKQYHYKATLMDFADEVMESPYSVQVIGEVVDTKTVFKFYCNNVEFSTAESGGEIFHVVARHILEQRLGGEKYYVYITDLELSPALLGRSSINAVQIIKYLKYKKNIEAKLNKALSGM